jgi:hypothetical protein
MVLAFYERKTICAFTSFRKVSSQIVQLQWVEQEGVAVVLAGLLL